MTQHIDVSVPAAGDIRSQLPVLVYSALID